MLYYKVVKDTRTGLIANELLTYKELMKCYGQEDLIKYGVVIPYELSCRKIHWSFGCRFEDTEDSE